MGVLYDVFSDTTLSEETKNVFYKLYKANGGRKKSISPYEKELKERGYLSINFINHKIGYSISINDYYNTNIDSEYTEYPILHYVEYRGKNKTIKDIYNRILEEGELVLDYSGELEKIGRYLVKKILAYFVISKKKKTITFKPIPYFIWNNDINLYDDNNAFELKLYRKELYLQSDYSDDISKDETEEYYRRIYGNEELEYSFPVYDKETHAVKICDEF